jgi:hypothetical protein
VINLTETRKGGEANFTLGRWGPVVAEPRSKRGTHGLVTIHHAQHETSSLRKMTLKFSSTQ